MHHAAAPCITHVQSGSVDVMVTHRTVPIPLLWQLYLASRCRGENARPEPQRAGHAEGSSRGRPPRASEYGFTISFGQKYAVPVDALLYLY